MWPSTAELQHFCLLIRHVTWWPYHWPFDLEQFSYMAGHVANPATKFEDPTTILSWVTSYNGSDWLPFNCERGHCACAESRDPWIVVQKQLHFWNLRPWFAYSLYTFGGSTMNVIKLFAKILHVFRWILHFICWMSAIFLLPVCLTYCPRKYTTRVDHHVNNSHQVWSPYADPFLSYEW